MVQCYVMVVEQLISSARQNRPRVECSDVLSAIIALLSNQDFTCKRCAATISNQVQSSSLPPSADQEPNHNVPLATVDNTGPASLKNSAEFGPTPSNRAGKLMRHILRDIKQLKATIIRKGAAHGDRAKRERQTKYVDELRQRKQDSLTRPLTPRSVSDDDDEYRASNGRYFGYDMNLRRFHRDHGVSGHVRAERRGRKADVHLRDSSERPEHLYNVHPPTRRSSSRWSKSVDDVVDGKYRDDLPQTWPRQKIYRTRPPAGQVATGAGSSVSGPSHGPPESQQFVPPYQRLVDPPRQQPLFPHHTQQQFQPQPIQMRPHQLPQSSIFIPIQQMAPAKCQSLVFVPTGKQHPPFQHHQNQPRRKEGKCRPVSARHSTDVATSGPGRSAGGSQQLSEVLKLAKSAGDLTLRIHKRHIT